MTAPPLPAGYHWLTTAPHPQSRWISYDAGQRGWSLHAVPAAAAERFRDVGRRQAACGLRPSHGWGLDLFITRPCSRCLRALGLACTACRGRGRGAAPQHARCEACCGRGTAAAQRQRAGQS